MKTIQHVRTPFFKGADQVPLARLSKQAEFGLQLEASNTKNTISLTFDDGPTEHTLNILDNLDDANVKATFFMLGEAILKRPDIAKEVIQRGHEIGNHTYDHQRADRAPIEVLLHKQIAKTNQIIEQNLGITTNLFRPAYGAMTNEQIKAVTRAGFHSFAWSIDTQDWYYYCSKKVAETVINHLHPGAIVLMHDGGGDRSHTAAALPAIIEHCIKEGFEFTTLSQHISK